jgi:hypothetical protein
LNESTSGGGGGGDGGGEFEGGGYITKDGRYLPHLAQNVYFWDQQFIHAAQPICSGLRINLCLFIDISTKS